MSFRLLMCSSLGCLKPLYCDSPPNKSACAHQVETKSGEEDEEILFKERAKLYRWDRDLNQWKERGVGDIKILYHPQKRFYRVLMRREQVLKVCANHTITQGMELKPMNTSTNALVWTATDYAGTKCHVITFKCSNQTCVH